MSVIEKPSMTCSATSPSVIAAHSFAPRTRTKNDDDEQRDARAAG